MPLQHAIQPPRLVPVPVNAILDLLWRIAREVVSLPLHGPHSRVLEKQPAVHIIILARAGGV
jgi:hypothetical protein